MDFSYLLELAKANEKQGKKEASLQRFSTKISSAKKVDKGPKSDAVKDFLDRKEAKKKEVEKQFIQDRNELLTLRGKDKTSKRKLSAMIKRTKGASKAVLDDAKDLITEKADEQCDEDDYGYESAMSQQIFSKLRNQYSSTPEDERLKFNKTAKRNIEDIKARVISNLKVEEEKTLGIRRRTRKRKSKSGVSDGFINDDDAYKKFDDSSSDDKESKISSHKNSSSKVPDKDRSHKKEREALNEEKKKKDRLREDKREELLRREKKEEELEKQRKREEKEKRKLKAKSAPPPMSFQDLMNIAQKKQKDPKPTLQQDMEAMLKKKELENGRPMSAREKEILEQEKQSKLRKMGKLPPLNNAKHTHPAPPKKEESNSHCPTEKPNMKDAKDAGKAKMQPPTKIKEEPRKKLSENSKYFSSFSAVKKPSESSGGAAHLPPKRDQEPPKRSLPSKPLSTKAPKNNSYNAPKRRIEDDSEEEDSDMDDFIDDEETNLDLSSEIGKIFGYDRSKFQDIDEDDLDDMEVSYSQVEKEEKMSAKLGLKEDLEDIKREEEEKKRKKQRLMMKK